MWAAVCKGFPGGLDSKAQVRSLGWEDPLEKEMALLQYSCLENPLDGGAW